MEKKSRGRPPKTKIKIIETDEVVVGYSEVAKRIDGNRGCVYLCVNNPYSRKSHKGYHFELVK